MKYSPEKMAIAVEKASKKYGNMGDLALDMGVSTPTLTCLRSGKDHKSQSYHPRMATFCQAAEFLGKKANFFFTG